MKPIVNAARLRAPAQEDMWANVASVERAARIPERQRLGQDGVSRPAVLSRSRPIKRRATASGRASTVRRPVSSPAARVPEVLFGEDLQARVSG